jgi:tetratricopeptide (TPR) repeat protein
MSENAIKCGACGKVLEIAQLVNGEVCPVCDEPARIKHYQTLAAMPLPQVNKYVAAFQTQIAETPNDNSLSFSLGLCFLKLNLHDKALPFFEKAMADNFADPAPYYYAAVCLLKGKKAFLAMRPEIDAIEKYLDAAISIEAHGIFYYFKAYIKYDYYSRKFFKTSPTWQEALEAAQEAGVSESDCEQFYQILGVDRPSCM